jgi:hypothetical protein
MEAHSRPAKNSEDNEEAVALYWPTGCAKWRQKLPGSAKNDKPLLVCCQEIVFHLLQLLPVVSVI